MKKLKKFWTIFTGSLVLTHSAIVVKAQDEGSTSTSYGIENPLRAENIGDLVVSVGVFIQRVSMALLAVVILWGAFTLMTSGGNPERVEQGRKTITWAIIGFVVVLIAGGVAAIVSDFLGGTVEPLEGSELGQPISGTQGIIDLIVLASRWMFGILMALGIVVVMYSAFLYLFSGGDEEKISTARRVLTYAIVAMVIAVLSGGVYLIAQNFVESVGDLPSGEGANSGFNDQRAGGGDR